VRHLLVPPLVTYRSPHMLDAFAHLALRALAPEPAHDLSKWAIQHRLLAPGPCTLSDTKRPTLFGQHLHNPLGLAAGFDKNAKIVDAAIDYGFGFVEVGSVTLRGGPGNPKPRMFRLDDETIMNRMGLNGDPAEVVAARLGKVQTPLFAVNIAKTHSPEIVCDAAIADIRESYKLLRTFGLYTAINISCPNTREGRTFEDPAPLADLLSALNEIRDPSARPLLVKLSPVLDPFDSPDRLQQVLTVCQSAKIDGYICCNTLPIKHPKFGAGGVSGHAVRERALRIIDFIRTRDTDPIIGCGGIYTHEHLQQYLTRGCVAAQAYNGFVRGPNAGVNFVRKVLRI
jgi:dihydroorotate dehydrogenase